MSNSRQTSLLLETRHTYISGLALFSGCHHSSLFAVFLECHHFKSKTTIRLNGKAFFGLFKPCIFFFQRIQDKINEMAMVYVNYVF